MKCYVSSSHNNLSLALLQNAYGLSSDYLVPHAKSSQTQMMPNMKVFFIPLMWQTDRRIQV